MSVWTFENLDANLEKVASKLPQLFYDMAVVCASNAKASHRKRLDRGEPKKSYKSAAYKKLRESKGRQTDYIDMQLSGELVRSMVVGNEGQDAVYGVKNVNVGKTDTSTIYRGQVERNKHGDLIKTNSEDVRKGLEASNRFFTDKIGEIFASV